MKSGSVMPQAEEDDVRDWLFSTADLPSSVTPNSPRPNLLERVVDSEETTNVCNSHIHLYNIIGFTFDDHKHKTGGHTSINILPSLSVFPHKAPPKYGVHGLSFHSLLSGSWIF